MNSTNLKLCCEIVDESYVKFANNSLNARENILKELLSQRQLPEEPLDDLTIEYLLNLFALMDTNNYVNKVGAGEREGRVFSQMVAKRHFNMAHGIGRSGDIDATQPKAAGSSIIVKLTKHLTKHALKICNYQATEVLVVPLATGMAISLCLLTLKSIRPQAKYVIWPRIDQKTCLKCIFTANLIPIVIEGKLVNGCLEADNQAIEEQILKFKDEVLCVLSTTSCFAPRMPDDIAIISQICKKYQINYVVNNAYGLQLNKIANNINNAFAKGTLDFVISSTDKNFMVPVGGAIIFNQDKALLKKVSEHYPGRASSSQIVDLFITLLSMGQRNLVRLLHYRSENYQYLLEKLAAKFGLDRIVAKNGISIAIQIEADTKIGAMLYAKKVMGARLVTNTSGQKNVCGMNFKNYGQHCDNYPVSYLTLACAIGMEKQEIDNLMEKLSDIK